MRWNISYFGIKDLFTIINILGGVFGVYFAINGQITYAGYAIFAGYVLGDSLDGPIARLTKTSNAFGGEFDSAADHLGQAIAPAVIVFAAYAHGGHEKLGVFLMAVIMTTASIRQARFNVDGFKYPLTYCGLPRTVSGMIAISLPNATLFFKEGILGYEGAAVVLIMVALMNITPIPYMTHKGRTLQLYVKLLVVAFFAMPVALAIVAPEFIFDFLFMWMFGYAMGAWIPLTPTERREFWAEYKRWSHQVAIKR